MLDDLTQVLETKLLASSVLQESSEGVVDSGGFLLLVDLRDKHGHLDSFHRFALLKGLLMLL